MRKKALQKRLARLTKKREALKARALASADANEVREIRDQIEELDDEITETQDEIDAIDAEEAARSASEDPVTNDTQIPANARSINPVASFSTPEQRSENPLATMDYRNAFRSFVMNGTEIPREFRAGEATSTNETGAAIPITIMNEVINTVRLRYGNLYNKVRKTNMKGGVEYPIGALKASFKWITEKTVSPRQKMDKLASISFKYHTGEIRISTSFLANIVTLDAFEAELARVIAIAYLEAMDYGIVNGTGDGQMLGILNDPRVTENEGHKITMTANKMSNWKDWRKDFFAKLPLGYRAGEFIFPLSTVETYLETMSDDNNNPVFRQATGLEVNDGDAMNPNGRFFGREISIVEPNIIADFDSAQTGDVIGIFWQPEEYAINENFGFTMRRYFDEEENEWVDKALVVVDGKVINPEGYYLIVKG